jgi:excisionase family DNA binding protein
MNDRALEGRLVRVPDAARFLSSSRSFLYGLMEKGELEYVKIGRSRRIPEGPLAELVRRNLVPRRSE